MNDVSKCDVMKELAANKVTKYVTGVLTTFLECL